MKERHRKTTPKPLPPDQEVLNIDGAAAFLGVSVKTFSKVLREGDMPGRKVGREWKFSRQALIDWIGSARSQASLEGEAAPRVPSARRRARPAAPGARKVDDGFSVDSL